jgi:hypothetical protein
VPRDDFNDDEVRVGPSRLRVLLIALGALVVVVAIICALVLSGALQGDQARTGPDGASTTLPTVEISP